jgi:hypothetical protein
MRFLVLLALLVPFAAHAQTVPASVTLNWSLPTTAADGSALTGAQALTSCGVWLSSATIPATTTANPTAVVTPAGTSTTQSFQVAPGGTIFARVACANSAGYGAFTNEVTKAVPVSKPGVPTNVTISITVG